MTALIKYIFLVSAFVGYAGVAHAECDLDAYMDAGDLSDSQIDAFNKEIAKCERETNVANGDISKIEALLKNMRTADQMLSKHNFAVQRMAEIRRLSMSWTSELLAIRSEGDLTANLATIREAVNQTAGFDEDFADLKANWQRYLVANEEIVGKEAYAYLRGSVQGGSILNKFLEDFKKDFPPYFFGYEIIHDYEVQAAEANLRVFKKALAVAEKTVSKQFFDNWNNKVYGDLKSKIVEYKADLYWSAYSKKLALDALISRSKREKSLGIVDLNIDELSIVKSQVAGLNTQAPAELKVILSSKIEAALQQIDSTVIALQKEDQQRSRERILLAISVRERQLAACGQPGVVLDKTKLENRALQVYYVQLEQTVSRCRSKK
ncbi:MAG: hypothetical protein J7501_14660 [Bdellovibrio sp.]|nr:hypothetical protein [Bdellovibrio sp.]